MKRVGDELDHEPAKRARIEVEESAWPSLLTELFLRIAWRVSNGLFFCVAGEGDHVRLAVPVLVQAKRPIARGSHVDHIPDDEQHYAHKPRDAKRGESALREGLYPLLKMGAVCKTWFARIDWSGVCNGIRAQLDGARVDRIKKFLTVHHQWNDPGHYYTIACLALAQTPKEREPIDMAIREGSWHDIGVHMEQAQREPLHPETPLVPLVLMSYNLGNMRTVFDMALKASAADIQRLVESDRDETADTKIQIDWDGHEYTTPISFSSKYNVPSSVQRIHAIWDYDSHTRLILGKHPDLKQELLTRTMIHWRVSEAHYRTMEKNVQDPETSPQEPSNVSLEQALTPIKKRH